MNVPNGSRPTVRTGRSAPARSIAERPVAAGGGPPSATPVDGWQPAASRRLSQWLGGLGATLALPDGGTAPPADRPKPADPGLAWCVNCGVPASAADQRVELARVKALGATMVRADFAWNVLEGAGPGVWNAGEVAKFRRFVDRAAAMGISVVPVLSAAHAPGWAQALYDAGRKQAFFDAYRAFCQRLAATYGDRVTIYQFGNENNSSAANWLTDPRDVADFWLAGDRGVRAAQPNAQGAVNVIADPTTDLDWLGRLEAQLAYVDRVDPKNTLRLVGVDTYPGTWSLGGPHTWNDVDRLMGALADPASPLHSRDAAIMETGYTTSVSRTPALPRAASDVLEQLPSARARVDAFAQWIDQASKWPLVGPVIGVLKGLVTPDETPVQVEADQARWYAAALPDLAGRLARFDSSHPTHPFRFVNLYTLQDGAPGQDQVPEAHFGLYRGDGTPKPAALVVQRELGGEDQTGAA